MSINRVAPLFCYGMGDSLLQLPPQPIIARRAPTVADLAQLGTLWIDTTTNTIYGLASIGVGGATWTATPAAGATILASLQITGAAGLNVSNAGSTVTFAGNVINFSNAGATTTIAGALTVAGVTTITGDLDLTSAALIDLTSTLNADPAIYLHADGGVNERIRLRADQGTGVNSIDLVSDLGGITLIATGNATADAINLTAPAGGIDMDSALQTNIASSQAAANAIRVIASAGTGGIDVDCGTGGIAVDSTGAVSIAGAAASDFTVGGAGIDLTLESTLGRVIVNGEEAAANAITLLSAVGGLDVDTALQINIDSSQVAADAIRIISSGAAGGIDIDADTAGITIDSAGVFSIDGVAASNITTTGAGIDLTLSSVLGSVLVESTENAGSCIRLHANGGVNETIQIHSDQSTLANSVDILSDLGGITLQATANATADAINITAAAGGIDVDADLQININSAQAAVDAIRVLTSNIAGGIDIDTGTGGIAVDTTGTISLDATAASNFTLTGAFDLTLASTLGSIIINPEEAAADAIRLLSAAGGLDANVALQMNLDSSQAAVDGIRINASNAAGGIDIDSLTGGVTIDSTGAISIDSIVASNFTVTGANEDLTLMSLGGSVYVGGHESIANAIWLHTNAGIAETIQIQSEQGTTANAITLQADQGGITIVAPNLASNDAINLVATVGGIDADAALQINVVSTQAAADAIVLNSSNAAGGIDLITGGGQLSLAAGNGNIGMVPATVVAAGVAAVLNARLGKATFTGNVTGAGVDLDLDITNAFATQGCGVFCTVSNLGVNDSDVTIEGVNTQTAGHLILHCINSGPAALNGDVVVTFHIID